MQNKYDITLNIDFEINNDTCEITHNIKGIFMTVDTITKNFNNFTDLKYYILNRVHSCKNNMSMPDVTSVSKRSTNLRIYKDATRDNLLALYNKPRNKKRNFIDPERKETYSKIREEKTNPIRTTPSESVMTVGSLSSVSEHSKIEDNAYLTPYEMPDNSDSYKMSDLNNISIDVPPSKNTSSPSQTSQDSSRKRSNSLPNTKKPDTIKLFRSNSMPNLVTNFNPEEYKTPQVGGTNSRRSILNNKNYTIKFKKNKNSNTRKTYSLE
jgi:hypothetical protein